MVVIRVETYTQFIQSIHTFQQWISLIDCEHFYRLWYFPVSPISSLVSIATSEQKPVNTYIDTLNTVVKPELNYMKCTFEPQTELRPQLG